MPANGATGQGVGGAVEGAARKAASRDTWWSVSSPTVSLSWNDSRAQICRAVWCPIPTKLVSAIW